MKKLIALLTLVIAILLSGCSGKSETPKETPSPEIPAAAEPEEDAGGADVVFSPQETTEPVPEEAEPVPETPEPTPEAVEPAQSSYDRSKADQYMASVEAQAESLEAAAQNATTQYDMNTNASEQYKLWDDALNFLWGELKSVMPEDAFAALLDEQIAWIAEKENAVAAAGKDYEGGTMYSLMVNSEAARITRDRCYYLYELLKNY